MSRRAHAFVSRPGFGLVLLALLWLSGCGGGGDSRMSGPDTTAPTAPATLTAVAIGTSRVDLSWSASTDDRGVVGYRVFRDGSASSLSEATGTTYSDTSVAAATSYTYVVRAVDAAGNISASSPAAATTTAQPGVAGLDARPSNAACLAWQRPTAGSTITLTRFTSLSFTSPVALLQSPNDNARWFVVEQAGIVRSFTGSSASSSDVFIDITDRVVSGGELGLLGMAFHPNYPIDNRVFLSYTNNQSGRVSRVSSFRTTNAGATLDRNTEQILMTVNQPEANHNGGHVAFGPDGYLYIGFGDGGGGGDEHGNPGNGQRLTTLLGKMLRIDVNGASPYTVPSSNPFFSAANPSDRCPPAGRATGNCPEIYAWGFRNPWRWSFDRANGDLWLGDVGQGVWEEVDFVERGGNYGWRCREGAHDYNTAGTLGCSTSSLIEPVTEYDHTLGVSITGGYVYRGPQTTSLSGRYLFADFGSGRIWAWIPETASQLRQPTQVLDSTISVSSFGEGNDGELYVVNYGGTLHRIVFQASAGGGAAPATLSATGCVNPSNATQPASGLIPYAINVPFWSDNAVKERFIGLPDGQNISVQQNGDWDFPNGTVLMKHFRIGTRLIETRLFMRHPDGIWGGFTYAWNAQQSDATLVQGGAVRDIGGGQNWIFPSESQCLECHTAVAGRSLGLETAQLNRNFTYPQTGRTANELFTLNAIGTLSPPIINPAAEPTMPDPTDATASLTNRARAYLHENCSQCHRPNGPTPSTMDLRYTTALSATNACGASPQSGDLGLGVNARLIAPGSAANSILIQRMNRRDVQGMPPVGSNLVDTAGVALITQWVNSLSGC